jgi:hypothetical protein
MAVKLSPSSPAALQSPETILFMTLTEIQFVQWNLELRNLVLFIHLDLRLSQRWLWRFVFSEIVSWSPLKFNVCFGRKSRLHLQAWNQANDKKLRTLYAIRYRSVPCRHMPSKRNPRVQNKWCPILTMDMLGLIQKVNNYKQDWRRNIGWPWRRWKDCLWDGTGS